MNEEKDFSEMTAVIVDAVTTENSPENKIQLPNAIASGTPIYLTSISMQYSYFFSLER